MRHAYARDTDAPVLPWIVLGLLSVVFSWGVYWILQKIQLEVPWWLEVPGPMAVLGALYYLTERCCWAWRPARYFLGIGVPNLRGDWACTVTSSQSVEEGTEFKGTARVDQTWHSIRLCIEFENSRSHSTSLAISRGASGHFTIEYLYRNRTKRKPGHNLKDHDGAVILETNAGKMRGSFFNDPSHRGSYGTIEFVRSQYQKRSPPTPTQS